MSAKKAKYYVVWQGKTPGIYTEWDECEAQVKGVEGAQYKSFATREEAEKAFSEDSKQYIVRRAAAAKPELSAAELAHQGVQYPSIAVDGACSGNPGKMEYQCVDTATKRQIFHGGPYVGGTNNIGEFLAIVHALAYLQQQALLHPENKDLYEHLVIYSDSKTAQAWVKKRRCATKVEETADNAPLMEVVRRAEQWLQVNQYTNPILKWQTEHWGEIPADFGRK